MVLAAITYVLAYRRGLRRIVEQPDIAPGDRSRAASGVARWLAARLLPKSIDRAIVLFTARTIARSRQHRLILAAYAGIAFAIAMAYLKSYLYGTARTWGDAEVSLLAPSVVMMVFAVIGARAVFALPISLPANWIFRVTAVHSPQAYFSAARKALAGTAVIPIWVACAAVYLTLWRGAQPWRHLLVLSLLGAILVFTSMLRFRKIPFACSYLPGKANLKVKLGMYGILFLFLCDNGVRIEVAALRAERGFVILTAILMAAAFLARWRTRRLSAHPAEKLQFEELPAGDLLALDLEQGPGGEIYIDNFPPVLREPVSIATRLEQIARDLWSGFRALAKSPGFSAAAIALIAMGIGGNTAIYSMIHGVLTRPAPGVQGRSVGELRDHRERHAGRAREQLSGVPRPTASSRGPYTRWRRQVSDSSRWR